MYFMGSFNILHTIFSISDIKRPDYDKAVNNPACVIAYTCSLSIREPKFAAYYSNTSRKLNLRSLPLNTPKLTVAAGISKPLITPSPFQS